MQTFNSSEDLKEAADLLLELVEKQARGEITEQELLREWKYFSRAANQYLNNLKTEAQKKEN